jgi:hypothetical protein
MHLCSPHYHFFVHHLCTYTFFLFLECVAKLHSFSLWLTVIMSMSKRYREIPASHRYFQWMILENGGDLLNL